MAETPTEKRPPLTALDFSILLVLSEGESYGYGIMNAVGERANGAVAVAPGNIYQALDRLISRGWIRELKRGEIPQDADPRRRYYALTAEGAGAAAAEARRLQDTLPRLRRLRRLPPGEG